MASAIEDPQALFGERPAEAGTSGTTCWRPVTGGLAEHQLDITTRHPAGEIRGLIIGCKD